MFCSNCNEQLDSVTEFIRHDCPVENNRPADSTAAAYMWQARDEARDTQPMARRV